MDPIGKVLQESQATATAVEKLVAAVNAIQDAAADRLGAAEGLQDIAASGGNTWKAAGTSTRFTEASQEASKKFYEAGIAYLKAAEAADQAWDEYFEGVATAMRQRHGKSDP